METRHYLTCLWPGLAELWWRGRLSALPIAIAFAFALNLILVTRYLFSAWISPGLVSMAFWIGVAGWIFYVVRSVRELPHLVAPRSVSDDPDHFPQARIAYLRGNWTEAEKLLNQVLAIEPRDPPSLLLLTGVYRHTNRLEAAQMLLKEMARLEVSDGWRLEVIAESKRLQQASDQLSELEKSESTETATAADLTESHKVAA